MARVFCACLAFLGAAAFGFWGIPSLSATHASQSSKATTKTTGVPNQTATTTAATAGETATTQPVARAQDKPEPAPAQVPPQSSIPRTPEQAPLAKQTPPSLQSAAPLPADTIAPQLLSHPEPTLTDAARQANIIDPVVKLALNVTTVGFSQNIRVIQSAPYGLNRKAIDAVSHWHFRPATRNGEPVISEIQVDVHFQP